MGTTLCKPSALTLASALAFGIVTVAATSPVTAPAQPSAGDDDSRWLVRLRAELRVDPWLGGVGPGWRF